MASAFTERLEIGGRPSGHAVAVLVPHIPARRQLDALIVWQWTWGGRSRADQPRLPPPGDIGAHWPRYACARTPDRLWLPVPPVKGSRPSAARH